MNGCQNRTVTRTTYISLSYQHNTKISSRMEGLDSGGIGCEATHRSDDHNA